MKGYIILALLMLIPCMAYFQKLHFEQSMKGSLEESVLKTLVEAGVEGPSVKMEWMDVEIKGRVKSVTRRVEVGGLVDKLPGVRLPVGGNGLLADGWLELSRSGEDVIAKGLLPQDYEVTIPPDIGQLVDEAEHRDYVVTPDAVLEWDEFLKTFFGAVGDRTVSLRNGRMALSGPATQGLRSDWLSEASSVVEREQVDDRFELYPSVYHLPGYEPYAKLEPETQARLRERLRQSVVVFEPSKSGIRPDEASEIASLATAILALGSEEEYVIGVLSKSEAESAEEMELWADRVVEVLRLLMTYGVRYEQFEVVDFSTLRDGEPHEGVEILLK